LLVRDILNDVELLGETVDDAAGEAFDKGGKVLGVGYPAGRIIDELASQGDAKKFQFPISYLRDRPGKMSFSGLKTALRVKLEKMTPEEIKNELPHLCASYQEAIVQSLRIKTEEVIEKILQQNLKTFQTPIVLGGGVACNSRLRAVMQKHFKNVFFVKPTYCTDNAAMIASWASLVPEREIAFPDCLELEAQARYVEKK
jgi:N6-L-threonylcarbamoyladenine synthase